RLAAVHGGHVRRQHDAVRVIQVRERVSVTGGGESGPLGVGRIDRLFGFGTRVRRGGSLAAECGGEQDWEGVAWAHGASPLGRRRRYRPCRRVASGAACREQGGPAYLVDR